MAGFDALVWLSEGEGMPHVLIEAGAAGVPVVATPDVGAVDVVTDDATGLLVPYRDPAAVARALNRLLANPRYVAVSARISGDRSSESGVLRPSCPSGRGSSMR